MTNQIDALKLALEALERMKGYGNVFLHRRDERNPHEQVCEAITAIKQALAAPTVQDEIATARAVGWSNGMTEGYEAGKAYAAQRQWVGLTETEFEALHWKAKGYVATGLMDVVRMVEAKLKELNT